MNRVIDKLTGETVFTGTVDECTTYIFDNDNGFLELE